MKKILDIIYLNTGFSRTILAEYAKLQNHSSKQAKRVSVFATALMLLEDFLLDEKLESTTTAIVQKLISQLELQLESQISFMPEHQQVKQKDLWKKLRRAQVEDHYENKGLWLPVLGFPHKPSMDNEEIESLREIGLWIKSFDDWADREKDSLAGKQTLFTNTSDQQSHIINDDLRNKAFSSFNKLNYPEAKKDYFLYKLHIQSIFFYAFSKELDGRLHKLKKLSEQSFIVSIFVMIISTRLVYKELLKL